MNCEECNIRLIKVGKIRVINSRRREKKKYEEIKESIETLGLKTPIVVIMRKSAEDDMEYDLVCGEGRLNAFRSAGAEEIPARVISAASREDVLLMGLVENIARRQANKIALIKEIKRLSKEGYSGREIARMVGKTEFYISNINKLIRKGRPEIVNAVVMEKIPLTTALKIVSCSDDQEIQKEINDAYDNGSIKASDLKSIQKLLILRKKTDGKTIDGSLLVAELKKRAKHHKDAIRKMQKCYVMLSFLKGAFEKMFSDEGFMALLECRGIQDIPSQLQQHDHEDIKTCI